MNTRLICAALLVACSSLPALAQPNIDATNKFAWTENCGWTNWRDAGDTLKGVTVGASFLSGFLWGENIGHINTGNSGGPYANTNNTNFGVNIGAGGYLNGLAWGENVGWINFDTLAALGPAQAARFDAGAGRFRGYAWGENIGWVNLDNATSFVAVAPTCCPGDANSSGAVNFDDLTTVLANFGSSGGGPGSQSAGDSDCSGTVNFDDITTVLANFGNVCP